MKEKHGLSQYRLNHAKRQAQVILEAVNKIEMMFQMSSQGIKVHMCFFLFGTFGEYKKPGFLLA